MQIFQLRFTGDTVVGYFPAWDALGIRHGISTRVGGQSEEAYASLNLGFQSGDRPESVQTNRRIFLESLQMPADKLISPRQVHGSQIRVVGKADAGRGRISLADALPDVDALITGEPELPLLLCFADCVPVLLADPVKKVVGLVHAGWRGTVQAIAAKTIAEMERHFGCCPKNCLAAIGPSIGACCYEVDKVVWEALAGFVWRDEVLIPAKDKQHWQLDLWQANVRQLQEAGVPAENILVSGVCTACYPELFYSYRRAQGKTGRLGAAIML